MRNQADVKELAKTALKTIIEKNHGAFESLFQPNLRTFVPDVSIFNNIADQVFQIFPTSLDVDAAIFTFLKVESLPATQNVEVYSYEHKTKDNKTIVIHIGVSSVDLADNLLHLFYIQPIG